jgi:hypothetical protein
VILMPNIIINQHHLLCNTGIFCSNIPNKIKSIQLSTILSLTIQINHIFKDNKHNARFFFILLLLLQLLCYCFLILLLNYYFHENFFLISFFFCFYLDIRNLMEQIHLQQLLMLVRKILHSK